MEKGLEVEEVAVVEGAEEGKAEAKEDREDETTGLGAKEGEAFEHNHER